MTQLYDHVCVTQANSIDEVLACISEMPDLEPAPDLIREPAPDLIRGGHRFARQKRPKAYVCHARLIFRKAAHRSCV